MIWVQDTAICAIAVFKNITQSNNKTNTSGVNFHSAGILCAKLCIAIQNLSIGVNVVSEGSPSRIRSVRLISLGMTILPRSSDCVNQVQKFFVKPRKALKYKDFSAFGAFTPVLLIESF